MQPIPTPFVLDPERASHGADLDPQAAQINDALQESCAYAKQLWDELDAVRGYLLTASPADRDDDTAWQNWIAASGSVTSAMCGPYGDAGFGLEEAQHEAQSRRAAMAESNQRPATQEPAQPSAAQEAAGPQSATQQPATQPSPAHGSRYKRAATVALVLLAIRGARPRRRAES